MQKYLASGKFIFSFAIPDKEFKDHQINSRFILQRNIPLFRPFK